MRGSAKHSQPNHEKKIHRHQDAKPSLRKNPERNRSDSKHTQAEDEDKEKYDLAQGYEDEFSEFEDDDDKLEEQITNPSQGRRHRSTH